MKYKTHPYVGYASLGVALGCMLGCLGVTLGAMATRDSEMLYVLSWWAMGLFLAAALAGVVATHTWPTYLERQHAVRHATRLADAMRWLKGPRTPGRTR